MSTWLLSDIMCRRIFKTETHILHINNIKKLIFDSAFYSCSCDSVNYMLKCVIFITL